MITCCLCGADCTGHAIQRVDGDYCPACNNPPHLSTLALTSLVVFGGVVVAAMVGVIIAIASWSAP